MDPDRMWSIATDSNPDFLGIGLSGAFLLCMETLLGEINGSVDDRRTSW